MDVPGGGLRSYRPLVERVDDPVYVLDADGHVVVANPAMAAALGYEDPAAVEGDHVSAFVPEADRRRRAALLSELVADGRTWATCEVSVLPAGGEPIPARDEVVPLTDDGELVGSVGVLRDVGDGETRTSELRTLYDRIGRLQSFSADMHTATTVAEVYDLAIEAGVAILGLDWCAIVEAREGWLELVAVSEDAPVDVGGRHLRVDEGSAGRVYQTGAAEIVRDAETSEHGKPADESIRSGLAVPIGDRGVFQATAGTAGAFDQNDLELAELLAAHVTEALRRIDRDRQLRELTSTVEQLHHATRTLQSCSTPEEVYDIVIGAAENILAFDWSVVAVDEDGWFELKAVSEDAPLAAGGRHLRTDEGIAGSVYQTGETEMIATPADHPDSAPVDDSFTANITVPLGDRGVFQANADEPGYFDEDDLELAEILAAHAGEALGRVEREQQLRDRERELRRQNERLDRFASVVSHDLRNPLNVAQGYLEAIDEPAAAEVETSLDRIETIIDEVLTLARQGRTVDDLTPVSLSDVASGAWRNVETAGADLVVETDATVLADRERLVTVFENLFSNAVEHGSTSPQQAGDAVEHGSTGSQNAARSGDAVEHGSTSQPDSLCESGDHADVDWPTVRVGATTDPPTLYVADDGPGVSPPDRESVFEMGYTTSDDGTGFGLAIVEEIAAAHGWDVAVTDAESGGARFEFSGVSVDVDA